MRTILFLLLALCIAAPGISQRPSQKEIEAQKQEALNEARQQVAGLKKEIADSKAKNEDPESIKELEKQLATIEQMVTMLAGTHLSGNKRPPTLSPSKTTEPKYISPFTPITLSQTVKPPLKEQATDHLLWYTGKKIDANTLITPSGVIVRYNRQQNKVIVQTDKKVDTPYYGLVNTLAQTPQMKSQFAIGMSGLLNSFLMWPEINKAYDEYNFFKTRYYNLAKNTMDLPDPVNSTIPQDPAIDRNLILLNDDLLMYLDLLTPVRGIVLPPKRPNDLCKCDGDEREIYEDDLGNWLDQFYAEEIKILHMLKAIFVHLAYREKLGYPTVVMPYLKQEYILAFNKVLDRSRQKLLELSMEYEAPEIYVEEGLVMATLSLQKLLIHTFGDIEEPQTVALKRDAFVLIEKVKGVIMQNQVFENYMKDQLLAKNYNVVFDYSLYLAHEYNKKLLSPSYRIEENFFQNWVEKLKKFNRFTLSIGFDVDYRIENGGSRGIKATATLESKPVIVSLGRSSCKWHFYLTDVNHAGLNTNEDEYYVPIKVINGVKTIYRDPEQPIILGYSGPLDMEMVFPNFELSFCKSVGPDTIYMEPLRYAESVANAYMAAHPKIDFGREFSLDMFQYTNKLFVSVLNTKQNADELIRMSGNMMNIQGQVQMPTSTGNKQLDNLFMDYLMNQQRRLMQKQRTPITNTSKTILQFNANNGDTRLVAASFDMIDPSDPDLAAGIKLATGIIKIKVEHTPR